MQHGESRMVIASQQQFAMGASVDLLAQRLLAARQTLLGRVAGVHENQPSTSFLRFGNGHADTLDPRHVQDACAHPPCFAPSLLEPDPQT